MMVHESSVRTYFHYVMSRKTPLYSKYNPRTPWVAVTYLAKLTETRHGRFHCDSFH